MIVCSEAVDPKVLGARRRALKYRHANLDKARTYARARMQVRRQADPEGEREKLKAWRKANPEKVKACAAASNARRAEKIRAARIKKKYGLSAEQYGALFATQEHRCGVCKAEKPNGKGMWFVDHCHTTERVRGILCSFCNSMLGYAKDNEATLANAIEYLRKVS